MRKKPKRTRFNLALLRNNKGKIALLLFVVLVVSIIIWTVARTNSYIFGGGSTSVQPVLSDLTANYGQINNSRQVVYNSLGSQAAITGVENDSYSFGFLSHTIDQPTANKLWGNYGIVPFVFGRDYVMLVYHLPNGVKLNRVGQGSVVGINPSTGKKSTTGGTPYLSFDGGANAGAPSLQKMLQDIYQKNPTKTWSDLFGKNSFTGVNANQVPISVTREEGSGTKEFFDGLLGPGKTGVGDDNGQIVATSNGSMLSTIENTPNSIGFVSYSYLKEVINAGLNIGAANTTKNGEPMIPYTTNHGKNDFNNDYTLTRPFSGILNTRSKNYQASLRFIAWMLDYSYYAQEKTPQIDRPKLTEPASYYADYWYEQQGIRTTHGQYTYKHKTTSQQVTASADSDWKQFNQNINPDPKSPNPWGIVNTKMYPNFKPINDLVGPVWKTINGSLANEYKFPTSVPNKQPINWNNPLMQKDRQRFIKYLDLK